MRPAAARKRGDVRWQVETLCGEPIASWKHRPGPAGLIFETQDGAVRRTARVW